MPFAREEDGPLRYQKALRGATGSCRSPETELMLEGEDDVVSLLQEKDMDNLGGPVVLSSPARLVCPLLEVSGTLSISTSQICFEVDQDDPAFARLDSQVGHPHKVAFIHM
ncbi:unnamed protein product [Boreogadus saida]